MIGSTSYLARDILVRVFYALGDGDTPFRVSGGAVIANAVLDFVISVHMRGGVEGLVIATCLCNTASVFVLLWMLQRRLGGRLGSRLGGGLGGRVGFYPFQLLLD